jgi:hypothetical protein
MSVAKADGLPHVEDSVNRPIQGQMSDREDEGRSCVKYEMGQCRQEVLLYQEHLDKVSESR